MALNENLEQKKKKPLQMQADKQIFRKLQGSFSGPLECVTPQSNIKA